MLLLFYGQFNSRPPPPKSVEEILAEDEKANAELERQCRETDAAFEQGMKDLGEIGAFIEDVKTGKVKVPRKRKTPAIKKAHP